MMAEVAKIYSVSVKILEEHGIITGSCQHILVKKFWVYGKIIFHPLNRMGRARGGSSLLQLAVSSHPLVDSHVNDWFLGGIRGRREEQLKG